MQHIFDPFFTTKPAPLGTGLGLSICHGIIREHGGHIWAESETGRGATFFIELPILVPSEIDDIFDMQYFKRPANKTQRILVIDDELNILHILKKALQGQGYQVDTVDEGQAGLDLVKNTSFDLILCDLHMPGMSGVEFLQKIEAQHPEMLKHIIFTTGDSIGSSARQVIEEKSFICLNKPFELDELFNQVHAALSAVVGSG